MNSVIQSNSVSASSGGLTYDSVNTLTAATELASGDKVPVADVSASDLKAMTLALLTTYLDGALSGFRDYKSGLVISNNASDATNDLDIATGIARDSTNVDNLILASALTKQLDATWEVGTNKGGMESGTSMAKSTWYSVWLIKRSDTAVVDALFSASATAPTMPAGYDRKRRIGWIRTDASGTYGAITPFIQFYNKVFKWKDTQGTDTPTAPTPSDTAADIDLLNCPPSVEGLFRVYLYNASTTAVAVRIYAKALSDNSVANTTNSNFFSVLGATSNGLTQAGNHEITVPVDASKKIRWRSSAANASAGLYLTCIGWTDYMEN